MTTQLALNISLDDHCTFSNFLPGINQEALHFFQQFCNQENEYFAYLWGPASSGKSHILQACCHETQRQQRSAFYLSATDPALTDPAILEGLDNYNLVCLDNLDRLVGQDLWEEKIFHFYNSIREKKHRLIVAAHCTATQLKCQLDDLSSRLSWGAIFQLKTLNDEEKIQALTLRAHNRGLDLPKETAQYILNRVPRDLASLFKVLDKLDDASFITQRRLTIPLAKQTLFD